MAMRIRNRLVEPAGKRRRQTGRSDRAVSSRCCCSSSLPSSS